MTATKSHDRRVFWLFTSPAIAFYTLFLVAPSLAAIWISLNTWHGSGRASWHGLSNYWNLVRDHVFIRSFINTGVILILVGAAVFIISFFVSVFLREMLGRQFARSVLLLPFIITPLALGVIWGFVFSFQGLANAFAAVFGAGPVPFMTREHLFVMMLIGLVWLSVGLYATILIAGFDRIPQSLFEVATIAGATRMQRFRYILFPMSRDIFGVASVLWSVNSLKIFEFILIFGGSAAQLPPPSTWNTALFVYAETFGGEEPSLRFGYASASAVVTLIAVLIFVLLLRRITRSERLEF